MNAIKRLGHNVIRWFDSEAESINGLGAEQVNDVTDTRKVNWQRIIPFFAVHPKS
mgnify:CR=1 FL=1